MVLPAIVLLAMVAIGSIFGFALLGSFIPVINTLFVLAVLIVIAVALKDVQGIKTDSVSISMGGIAGIFAILIGIFQFFNITPQQYLTSSFSGLGVSSFLGLPDQVAGFPTIAITTLALVFVVLLIGMLGLNAIAGKKVIRVKK